MTHIPLWITIRTTPNSIPQKNIKKKKLDAIDSFYPIIIHDG